MKFAMHSTRTPKLAEVIDCGCCNHFHPPGFDGDCRDGNNRLSADQLDAQYGPGGWIASNEGG
ncbi:hypothetical protein [Paraburkholderia sp. SIMBA_054]|uniref:hypothetical protein n=1 Tax=Paraburkholderia sp. SIMBA_054 TaxID=3085795 RepID=UPI00397BA184